MLDPASGFNPRPFFRCHPLVDKDKDTCKLLLATAKAMGNSELAIRGVETTDELYDLILFVTHSFARPTTTELYALRHADIQIADMPKRLLLTVRNGKTGYRIANSLEAAVSVYQRIKQRHFNKALEIVGIKFDPHTNQDHSVYSLRHTAICMRIILSHGHVNVFNLANSGGTSVEPIERFYARNLPLSAQMARNLKSF